MTDNEKLQAIKQVVDDYINNCEMCSADYMEDIIDILNDNSLDIKNLSDIVNGICMNDTDVKFDIPEEDSLTKYKNSGLAKSIAEWNKAIEKRGYIN